MPIRAALREGTSGGLAYGSAKGPINF